MRILCLAVLIADFPQLMKKFHSQIRHLQEYNPDTLGFAFGPSDPKRARGYNFRYLSLPFNYSEYMAAADSLAQSFKPDIIYFRYPGATRYLQRFVRRHPNVVFEHNTMEEAELTEQSRVDEVRWGSRVLAGAAGLCGVTDEILRYEQQRAGNDKPALMLGNGIEPESVPPLDFILRDDAIQMISAAHFSSWHGVDRLLKGMAAHKGPERFLLHLAGIGPELPLYREMVQSLNLTGQVMFHGQLDQTALHALAASCRLGVGALALHRKAMAESTALKHREYCLLGLPFFFAGQDVDFQPAPDFVLSVPNDESPIDMATLVALTQRTRDRPALRREMRRYGEERLSWRVKCGRLYNFLRNCAGSGEAMTVHSDGALRPDAVSTVIALDEARAGVFDGVPVGDCPDLGVTLQALREQQGSGTSASKMEIVLVGSPRQTEKAAALWRSLGGATHEIVHAPPAMPEQKFPPASGHWAAWNAGMKAARAPWLLPLLPGDSPSPDLLQSLARAVRSRPELNMLTATARDTEGREWLPQGLTGILDEKNAPAGCLLFRKSLWEDVGGYKTLHPFGLADALFWLDCRGNGLLRRHLPRTLLLRADSDSRHVPAIPHTLKSDARAMLVTLCPALFSVGDVLKAQSLLLNLETTSFTVLQTCLERHPDQAWPRFCLGLAHEGRGELAAATACHLAAAKLDPEDWQPHLRLYALHIAQGLMPQAILDKKACLEREYSLRECFSEKNAAKR